MFTKQRPQMPVPAVVIVKMWSSLFGAPSLPHAAYKSISGSVFSLKGKNVGVATFMTIPSHLCPSCYRQLREEVIAPQAENSCSMNVYG